MDNIQIYLGSPKLPVACQAVTVTGEYISGYILHPCIDEYYIYSSPGELDSNGNYIGEDLIAVIHNLSHIVIKKK
jgi:hypothetical protein